MPILNDSPTLISLLSFFFLFNPLGTRERRRGKRRGGLGSSPIFTNLTLDPLLWNERWIQSHDWLIYLLISWPWLRCIKTQPQPNHYLSYLLRAVGGWSFISNHCLTNPYLSSYLILSPLVPWKRRDKIIEEIINQLMIAAVVQVSKLVLWDMKSQPKRK